MHDIIITIAPFAQGVCLGSAVTFVLCVLAVWGLMAYSRKQQKEKLAEQFAQMAQGGGDETFTT